MPSRSMFTHPGSLFAPEPRCRRRSVRPAAMARARRLVIGARRVVPYPTTNTSAARVLAYT